MLVLNLPAFENKKYTAYDCFQGHGPYGENPTKKEPIRTLGFTSRLPCLIIISDYAGDKAYSRVQQSCKFIGTKESVSVAKELNSHRIALVHEHDRCFTVCEHQYGRHDVMCILYFLPQINK